MSGLLLQPMQQSKWGSPQEVYTRFCMVILFHRAMYYFYNSPVITDHQYDLMERYLWHLIQQGGVLRSIDDPLRNPGCPQVLPRTVEKWIERHQWDNSLPHGYVMQFDEQWVQYLLSLNMADAEKI